MHASSTQPFFIFQSLHSTALTSQDQAHVVMANLSKSLAGAVATTTGQLLALSDSDLADSNNDAAGDESDEASEVFGARAAMLRAYHLLLVAQPVSLADRDDVIKHAEQLLQVKCGYHS